MPEFKWHATVTESGSGHTHGESGTVTASTAAEAETNVAGYLNSKRTARQDVDINVHPRG